MSKIFTIIVTFIGVLLAPFIAMTYGQAQAERSYAPPATIGGASTVASTVEPLSTKESIVASSAPKKIEIPRVEKQKVVPMRTEVVIIPPTPKPITIPTQVTQVLLPEEPASDVGQASSIGLLNQRDIWFLTNTERENAGLPQLGYSKRLTAIAEAKALDMIAKQYFEHVSPTGVGIKQLSEMYGYQYLSIGENLALGNFTSSAHVVKGWMNSPGHKANILNKNFTEIGVAAIVGLYEGQEVWFAVQEFGRPLSDCPQPNEMLRQKIIIFNTQLNALQSSLRNLDIEIATATSTSARNQKASDYNTIAALHNSIVETIKADVSKLNAEVSTYNSCTGSE